MSKLDHPVKFQPVLMEKIWGGERLYELYGKGAASKKQGESWELSDREEASSRVTGGTFDGVSFRDLFSNHQKEILGEGNFVGENQSFPLLFKYIHAREKLSVQVHPENKGNGDPKTEAWHILEAPAGAKIIAGLSTNEDRESVLRILGTSQATAVLNQIPIAAGDTLYIPAGTVHAITEGIVLYEIQQNSDTTFRLYDWDRMDDKGHPRQLHLREAAEAINFSAGKEQKTTPLSLQRPYGNVQYLVACPFFATLKFSTLRRPFDLNPLPHFYVQSCTKGRLKLSFSSISMDMKAGDTVLIPALSKNVYIGDFSNDAEFLLSFVPHIQSEILEPLMAEGGFSREEILRLGGVG